MKPLAVRTAEANALLGPYAVPIGGGLGRLHDEPEDETRFPFQRDRDRIIHTQAFRRLKGKTQVFVAGEGDHYRTRLTHTMEVAQISRDVARTMGLNEDLTECIALAHDLGHPPFGHAGEAALDEWMRKYGSSFEHNEQSVRILTVLEEHSSLWPGLNLNKEVLEGLMKHAPRGERGLHLEAQIVNLADEIAYTGHDCDDGLHAGLFARDELTGVGLVRDAMVRTTDKGTSLRGSLIHLLVMDLYAETQRRIRESDAGSLQDIYRSDAPLVGFTSAMQTSFDALRGFLSEKMYGHERVLKAGREGRSIVQGLCDALITAPSEKTLALQRRTGGPLAEAVKDYVAGMTDAFAGKELRALAR